MLAPEAIAIVVGLLVHQFIFVHGEWHLRGPKVVVLHIAIATIIYSAGILIYQGRRQNNVLRITYSILSYNFALFSSIAIYRIFLHRLKQFPGPRIAALTKLWHVWKCRDSRGHLVLQAWYEEYGEFVRTGKNSDIHQNTILLTSQWGVRSRRNNHLPPRGIRGNGWPSKSQHPIRLVRLTLSTHIIDFYPGQKTSQ